MSASKWFWKMDYCKNKGLSPAVEANWATAEREYNILNMVRSDNAAPKLPFIIESNEPCDYCIDRHQSNCKNSRNEYFPSCFKGQQLRIVAKR